MPFCLKLGEVLSRDFGGFNVDVISYTARYAAGIGAEMTTGAGQVDGDRVKARCLAGWGSGDLGRTGEGLPGCRWAEKTRLMVIVGRPGARLALWNNRRS